MPFRFSTAPAMRLCCMTHLGMRRRATGEPALTVGMLVAAPVIVAAKQNHTRRPRHHHLAAVTPTAHGHDASRRDHQQRYAQPERHSVRQAIYFFHKDLSFAEGTKQSVGFRNITKRVLIIENTILPAWPVPQVWRADLIKSPSVKFNFGFAFIIHNNLANLYAAMGCSPHRGN